MGSVAPETLDVAHEISKILDCGLDKETLSLCLKLLETGVNPEALAQVIKRLREEASRQASRETPSA